MPATAADLPQDLIDQVRALSPAQKAALRVELDRRIAERRGQ